MTIHVTRCVALMLVVIAATPGLTSLAGQTVPAPAGIARAMPAEPVAREVVRPSGWLSPDERLAASYVSPDSTRPGVLEIRDLATGTTHRLVMGTAPIRRTFNSISRIVWSPDSKRLAFAWCAPELLARTAPQTVASDCDVRIASASATDERVIHPRREGEVRVVSWTPDGRHLLVHLLDRTPLGRPAIQEPSRLAMIEVSSGAVRELKTGNLRWWWLDRAQFSPDGRYLALTINDELAIMAMDGSDERLLIEVPANRYFMAWTPSGRSLLFAMDRDNETDLWIVPVIDGQAQGTPALMKRDVGSILPEKMTQSGAFYYSSVRQEAFDIHASSVEPGTGRLLSPPMLIAPSRPGQTALPAWSPDGKQVAYKSSNTIVVASITGGEERRMMVPAPSPRMPPNVETFSWAPDGETLLVSMSGPSGPQNSSALVTASVRTGEFATMLEPPDRQWISQARWLPDGKSMVFMQAGDVVLRNGDTGAQRALYPQVLGDEDRGAISVGRSRGLAVSPDGRRIAFSRRHRQTGYSGATFVQTIVDIADGQARDVTPFSNNVEASTWSHDGRYLLYVEKEGRDSLRTLWRVPATGGARERLGEFPVPTPGYVQSLSMRSDGRQLAFGMVRAQYEPTFVIEDFLPPSELKTTSTPRR